MNNFLWTEKDGVGMALHVQPKASKNRFIGLYGEAVKLAVTAPPADGKANKAVIVYLSGFFKIPKSAVTIKSGLQSRKKRIYLNGISLEEARKKLGCLS
jgi:uncharacterized protein (TIGR00251 family)